MKLVSVLAFLAACSTQVSSHELTAHALLSADPKSEESHEEIDIPDQGSGNDETAKEKFERREDRAIAGSLGAPHTGEPLDKDGVPVPPTIAESAIKGNAALESVHGLAQHVIAPIAGVLIACIVFTNILGQFEFSKYIPSSALTIAVSIVVGVALSWLMKSGALSEHTFTFMSVTVLNLLLLPMIIFYSGWNVQIENFVSQFQYILIFAVFGTVLSTGVIGFGLWYAGEHLGWHVVTDLRTNLAFATLISATDPVATLSTYAKFGMPAKQPLLNILVFGESAINDAVAVVIFGVINEDWHELDHLTLVGHVMFKLFGSMAFGAVLAAVLVYLLRVTTLPGHGTSQVLYIFVSAYFIYAMAEAVHVSGIIANLFAGMVFGVYGRKNLGPSLSIFCSEYLEVCSELADTGVFVLCGISSAMIHLSTAGWCFGLLALAMVLVTRAVAVTSCAAVSNGLKKLENEPNSISWRHQVMMWWGGLRGGIALVLALEINGEWCEHKSVVLNVTFVIVCFLLLALGGTTEVIMQKLGLIQSVGNHISQAEKLNMSQSLDCILPSLPRDSNSLGSRMLASFDKNVNLALCGEYDEDSYIGSSAGLDKIATEKA